MRVADNLPGHYLFHFSIKCRIFLWEFSYPLPPTPWTPNFQIPVHIVLIDEPLAFAKVLSLANDPYLVNDSDARTYLNGWEGKALSREELNWQDVTLVQNLLH